jgi:hypothetical protein
MLFMNERQISQVMRIAEGVTAIEFEIGTPGIVHCSSFE